MTGPSGSAKRRCWRWWAYVRYSQSLKILGERCVVPVSGNWCKYGDKLATFPGTTTADLSISKTECTNGFGTAWWVPTKYGWAGNRHSQCCWFGRAHRLLCRQSFGRTKQRVAIARALASHPKVVADEPTASLEKSGRDVVEIMQRLAKEQDVPFCLSPTITDSWYCWPHHSHGRWSIGRRSGSKEAEGLSG